MNRRFTMAALRALLALALPAAPAAALEIVVPAYFYPSSSGSDWNDLNAAAGVAPITAIMNPNSGPGSSANGDYTTAVNSLRAAGGRVIGYVSSSYANRPLQQVLGDIDKYAAWYDIDGIFVDEMTNNSLTSNLDFYQAVYDHIKSIDSGWEVMGNPGTTTQEAYLTRPTADRLMVFENFASSYPSHTPSSWNASYDSSTFVNLLHQLDPNDVPTMEQYVDLAVSRNVGGVFFTDDVLPNPWDRLPEFWDQMVAKVAAVNSFTPGPQETLRNPLAAGVITIDGSRDDWQGVTPYASDDDDSSPGPQLDYQTLTVANDAANLYFRFQVDESVNGTAPMLGTRHNLYLDIDHDRSTGFIGTSGNLALGAEYLVQGGNLYAFQGASQQSFSWEFLQSLAADDASTDDIELSLPRDLIGAPESIDMLLNAANSVTEDYYPNSASGGATGGFLRYLIDDLPPVVGDYDGDRVVGMSDYFAWRSQYGAAGGAADGNQDGRVDAADYAVWRAAYQSTPGAVGVAVPEGSALAYFLISSMYAWLGLPQPRSVNRALCPIVPNPCRID